MHVMPSVLGHLYFLEIIAVAMCVRIAKVTIMANYGKSNLYAKFDYCIKQSLEKINKI